MNFLVICRNVFHVSDEQILLRGWIRRQQFNVHGMQFAAEWLFYSGTSSGLPGLICVLRASSAKDYSGACVLRSSTSPSAQNDSGTYLLRTTPTTATKTVNGLLRSSSAETTVSIRSTSSTTASAEEAAHPCSSAEARRVRGSR